MATATADAPDPYKVLQVDPEADPEVIQAAYRRLAQKYHPDVAAGAEAKARMVAINEAWAILRDPEARAGLDAERAARRQAATNPPLPGGLRDAVQRKQRGPADSPAAEPTATSADWSPGRSSSGSGYDPRTMRASDEFGAAGPAPGNPSGSVLAFGRFAGWSLGEIARRDIEYLEWLDRMPIGRPYRSEIDSLLRGAGRRRAVAQEDAPRRGLFRR